MDSGETRLASAGEYQLDYHHQRYGEGYHSNMSNTTNNNTYRNHNSGGCSQSEDPTCKKRSHACSTNQSNAVLHVFCWGRGEDGQLGVGDTSAQEEPVYVDSLRGIGVKDIACGSGHTVVLTCEGEIMSWGRGDDGRLGHGDHNWKYVPRPVVHLSGYVISQITCGSYHTAAVASSGELWTWGGGMYGKLGHGNENGHSTPKRVEALLGVQVASVACGSRHTVIVTNLGKVYSWGDRENGVAGHGEVEGHQHQYKPKLIEKLKSMCVVQISACGFHTGCLTEDGKVYTWGEGKFGRLGGGNENHCHTPRLVESLIGKSIKQIACGGFHTAAITDDGKLATFGGGEHGQLGHGDRVNKLKPTFVQALDGVFISQITCGWSHTVALTSNGKVYSWGNNDHGKLGVGSRKKVSSPQLVDKLQDKQVVKIASYNEHTAVLVEPYDNSGNFVVPFASNSVSVTSSYVSEIKELINNEEFSDVTFIVEGRPIYAHRAILAQRSAHFAAMFRSGMRESTEREVKIHSISYSAFLLLMEFIYIDSVKVDAQYAVELFVVADLYQLDRLKDSCSAVAKRNINCENAAVMLQEASNANCDILKNICIEFIVQNFDVVSKSDGIKELSHSLLLEVLAMRP